VIVAILFTPPADVVDAEARRAVLGEAQAAAEAVLERHGAVVEPLHTGAIMGVFGIPAVHEDDSLRALRAAVELRSGGDAAGTTLQIGVDSGPAIVRATQLFTVLGAPGIGKSKLAREFAEAVGDEARVLQGQCLPYGDGVTFWPLREIIREALGDDGQEAIESVFDGTDADVAAAGRV